MTQHKWSSLVFVATLVGLAAVGLAKPAETNPGTPFEALAQQHRDLATGIQEVKHDTILMFPNVEKIDLVDGNVRLLLNAVRVEVRVDTEACASGLVQCGPVPGPAHDQNAMPIRAFVMVTQNGAGVAGLTADAFTLTNPFMPAGGHAAQVCSGHCRMCTENCNDSFQDGQDGVYSIFLEPRTDQENWHAGTYAGTVVVRAPMPGTSMLISGTGMMTFTIPAGPEPIK